MYEISGSHGGEYEDNSLLGYSTVYSRGRHVSEVRTAFIIALMMISLENVNSLTLVRNFCLDVMLFKTIKCMI
jgi:hypothetical protein